MFLLGLAIPLQATIIPVYLIIIRLDLYDTLRALILPSIAFAIPLTVLILTNFLRDVPQRAVRVDADGRRSEWRTLWRLALAADPAGDRHRRRSTTALHVWNGFLFPLVLTQSPRRGCCRWRCGRSRASTA